MFKLIIAGLMVCTGAIADVVVEEAGGNAVFKVDGKQSTPVEAQEAARTGKHKVEKCTPIKGAVSSDGENTSAYRCKRVILRINPKTGSTSWKNE